MYLQSFLGVHRAPLERRSLTLVIYKHPAPPEQSQVSQSVWSQVERFMSMGGLAAPKLKLGVNENVGLIAVERIEPARHQ